MDKFSHQARYVTAVVLKIHFLKDLSIRYWNCPNCGMTNIDRDVNAAQNIKHEGLRLLLA